jgi:hypothetical protein
MTHTTFRTATLVAGALLLTASAALAADKALPTCTQVKDVQRELGSMASEAEIARRLDTNVELVQKCLATPGEKVPKKETLGDDGE